MMRIPARFHKGANRFGRLGLAEQYPVHAAAKDLAELPGIEADIGGVGAINWRLDNDRRSPMPGARWPALHEPAHVRGKAGHVEGPVLHSDIDVVGPDMRVLASLLIGQHVAAVAAGIIDSLILL